MNKIVKVKKLYRNHISLRDYVVENAIKKNIPIKVLYNKKSMMISVDRLKKRFSLTPLLFSSKFSENQQYKLYDFEWKNEK